jgi:uncharacterized protein (DUF1919 family)
MSNISTFSSAAVERFRLNEKQFVLISNNCWGYELYNLLGRAYNTPFVGVFLFADCYLKLLENFSDCMNSTLKFSEYSKYVSTPQYPVGVLFGGVEIHFLHYSTRQDALEKWNRRSDRLLAEINCGTPIYIKICDRDGCTSDHLRRFHEISFGNKLSIGVAAFDSPNHVCVPMLGVSCGSCVVDGLKLFRRRYRYFDISDWIQVGIVRRSLMSRVLSLM